MPLSNPTGGRGREEGREGERGRGCIHMYMDIRIYRYVYGAYVYVCIFIYVREKKKLTSGQWLDCTSILSRCNNKLHINANLSKTTMIFSWVISCSTRNLADSSFPWVNNWAISRRSILERLLFLFCCILHRSIALRSFTFIVVAEKLAPMMKRSKTGWEYRIDTDSD